MSSERFIHYLDDFFLFGSSEESRQSFAHGWTKWKEAISVSIEKNKTRPTFYSFSLNFYIIPVSMCKTDPIKAMIWKAYLLSISKSQFSTHYMCIIYIPWVVAHCTPLSVVPNFDTTLIMVCAIYKTNGGLASKYRFWKLKYILLVNINVQSFVVGFFSKLLLGSNF